MRYKEIIKESLTNNADYLYHGTSKRNLTIIKQQGLVPRTKLLMRRGRSHAAHSLGRIFFTDSIDTADFYALRKGGRARTILRVKRNFLPDIQPDNQEENGFFIERNVPPDEIEFWNGKTWINITAKKNLKEYRQDPLANAKFKAWFGDSKVVDAHGNPQMVFHGTTGDFDTFARDVGGQGSSGAREGGLGFWFTENPKAASDFAEWSSRNYDPSIVMPMYLKIEHPWIVKEYKEIRELIDRHTKFSQPPHRMIQDKVDYTGARNELIHAGYDGIILPNTMTDSPDGKTPITQYVALYSTQMKSAVGNKGNFDPYHPSITETVLNNP